MTVHAVVHADVLENKEEERINTDEIIAWVNQHQFTYAVHSSRYITYITAFGHWQPFSALLIHTQRDIYGPYLYKEKFIDSEG